MPWKELCLCILCFELPKLVVIFFLGRSISGSTA